MLYGMMQDYGILTEYANAVTDVSDEVPSAVENVTVPAKIESVSEPDESRTLPEDRIDQIMENWPAAKMLTNRELDVLRNLLENKKRKDIAEELHVTEHTIKKHTANIFSKLDVTNRMELLAKAEQETSIS